MVIDYSLISFLVRGQRRKKVLLSLEKPKTPKEIANECKISISNVSNALAELLNKKLIVCLTPKEHFCRFYKLTEKGKELIKQLKDYEKV